MDITPVLLIIIPISYAMIGKALFPNIDSRSRFFHVSMGISAFDELHRTFEGNGCFRRKDQMNVVWHGHEFVKLKDSAIAIAEHCVEK